MRKAHERDAPLDDRPGSDALSQGSWHGGEALLHRPRADGESSGLIVDAHAGVRHAERLAALEMIELARIVRARSRSAPTRAMTRPISSKSTHDERAATGVRASPPSTGALPDTEATAKASAPRKRIEEAFGGSRRSRGCARPASSAAPRPLSPSPSPRPPTISCARRS